VKDESLESEIGDESESFNVYDNQVSMRIEVTDVAVESIKLGLHKLNSISRQQQ